MKFSRTPCPSFFCLLCLFFILSSHRRDTTVSAFVVTTSYSTRHCITYKSITRLNSGSDKDIPSVNAEIVQEDDDDYSEEYAWMPDREKARMVQENQERPAAASPAEFYGNSSGRTQTETFQQQQHQPTGKSQDTDELFSDQKEPRRKRLTYTDEEEELIEIMGGKDPNKPSSKRESGFLGDCTLKEIAQDYQCPICYLGDVLCGWGVPPPIDANGLLGDMVTGEQAFAILEAIHTLDMGALNERYAEYDLATLCNEYDIELADGFELAMKEGWNLPFGVRTYLRVEQEEHLIDTLAKDIW